MRITRQLEDLAIEPRPIVLAVGSFDGVHRGHQRVIERAVAEAAAANAESWVLTFDPHPLKVLMPRAAPPLITANAHKLQLIEPLGVSGCVLMPFTREVARIEPAAFIERLQAAVPELRGMVVGSNWTFGHRARGNVELLSDLAPRHGFGVTRVEPVLWKGEPISSTRVRQAVSAGRLAEAEEMLGRPFSVFGTVVRGRNIGRQLGFPTANLDPHNEVRPPSGVYAARVTVRGRAHGGAAFVAETADAQSTPSGFVIEAYILDFEGSLYGEDIEIGFLRRLREVRRFASMPALREQIGRDVEAIREQLGLRAPERLAAEAEEWDESLDSRR